MEWRIQRDSSCQTLTFAAEELAKYLQKIDPTTQIALLKSNPNLPLENHLLLAVNNSLTHNPQLDDAYSINISGGKGSIMGSNPRSVLFGVYRFLHSLGCRWLHPGQGGETIPSTSPASHSVSLTDRPSYRHRGVCIEGSCSFAHVQDMIDWMPKVGMNAYFNQFFTPFAFFNYWYKSQNDPASYAEVTAMVEALTEGIKKRGLLYHATGHGWTCDPIGIPGNGWEKEEFTITDQQRQLLAEVDGKREVYRGIALNTNLCYSNPAAQGKIVTAITDYCRSHPQVDYLHFWLADAPNNHCECESCRHTPPSDFYIMMLNEIDRILTAENIPTKIVTLIYFDLLWPPESQKIINQDRFTLMFAPITRTYTHPFTASGSATGQIPPFQRNKLKMPKSIDDNLAHLKTWQSHLTGDSFDFDYHLIWDHYHDPGGHESARILFEDMKNLDKIGLNGMISCQVQRAAFPTGLAMYAMAAALWNKNQDFSNVAAAFYADMFGEAAAEMQQYFASLSLLFQPSYMRGEQPYVNEESAAKFAKAQELIREMQPKLTQSQTLTHHASICLSLAQALELKAKGQQAEAEAKWQQVVAYASQAEPDIHHLFDTKYFTDVIGRTMRGVLHFG
ncbi:MAG: DUF4838 domain-containing protein [Defluviitaleaceae bacterium]|nr:DUF4838 domain-containing protein [Defluviitaleaceae bacterium]